VIITYILFAVLGLLGLLGLLALLLLIACARAVLIKSKTSRGQALQPDKASAATYAKNLSKMLQHETVDDPNASAEALNRKFADFHHLLTQLYPLTHKHAERIPLDNTLLLRWRGLNSNRPAIVLMSHSDVVAATGDWTHPPYSGTIADGAVWGRGAVDTKGALCAIFEAAEGLIATGFTPPCDVYILSSNNEETLGDGAEKAVQYLLENGVKLDLVSDEGGAVVASPFPGTQGFYAMLGIVEKGHANVRFVAKSNGGHASAPPKMTPMAQLAAFVDHMEKKPPFKVSFSAPVVDMFTTLAPHMSFPLRLMFGNLWLFRPVLTKLLPGASPQAGAMLRTTCVFTMAQGSPAPNVIPETASVTANIRFGMTQGMDESLAIIKRIAAKFDIETEVLYAHDCPPSSDTSNSRYRYFADCVAQIFPEAIATPYVMVGGTDARYFAEHCPCTVRFAPITLSKQQLNSVHGLDENLSVHALGRAVEFYTLLLRAYK